MNWKLLCRLLRENSHQPSYGAVNLVSYCDQPAKRYPVGAMVAWMLWGQPNTFLTGFKRAWQEEVHSWYYKSEQEPLPVALIGPRGERTAILPNGHSIN